jgi:hypothetical protein
MTSLDEAIRLLEISGEGTKQKALELLRKLRREQQQVPTATDAEIQRAFEREI